MPMTMTRVSTREEGTMQRDRTDAKLRDDDDQPRTRSTAPRGVAVRTLTQPAHAMANLRTTIGLIAALLLVWVVIVAA